jgi:hypothetical protein
MSRGFEGRESNERVSKARNLTNFFEPVAGDGGASVGFPKPPGVFEFKCQYATEAPLCFSA